MTPDEAREHLEALEHRAEAAKARSRWSRQLAEKARNEDGGDVVSTLAKYHADVLYRRRAADPAEPRRLTVELARRLLDDELVVEPLDCARPAAGVRIYDPRPAREAEADRQAAEAARRDLDAFRLEAAALLKEAEERQAMDRVRDALGTNDPTALAEAMRDLPAARPRATVLRTEDLPR